MDLQVMDLQGTTGTLSVSSGNWAVSPMVSTLSAASAAMAPSRKLGAKLPEDMGRG